MRRDQGRSSELTIVFATSLMFACANPTPPSAGSAATNHSSSGRASGLGLVSVIKPPPGGKTLVFLRHGEKPNDPTKPDLSPEGEARAQALPSWFSSTFGQLPGYLGCMIKRNPKKSNRGWETCQPTADASGTAIEGDDASYWRGVVAQGLASGASLQAYVWHHSEIPAMAQSTGCTNAPQDWPQGSYSASFVVTLDAGNNAQCVQQVDQGILPSDPGTVSAAQACTANAQCPSNGPAPSNQVATQQQAADS